MVPVLQERLVVEPVVELVVELVPVGLAALRHQLAVFAEWFDLPFSLLLST